MGYSKEIIEAANRAMEQRRRQSITKAEQRMSLHGKERADWART